MADEPCYDTCLYIRGPVPTAQSRTRPYILPFYIQNAVKHIYALQATPSIVSQCLLRTQLSFSSLRVALGPPRALRETR